MVLNSLAGAAIAHGLAVLAEDGRFVEVGKTDIYSGRSIGLGEFRKRISFATVDLAGLARTRPQRLARLLAEVWQQITAGRLAPVPVRAFPFAEAARAVRTMSAGHHIGKLVLTDPDTVESVSPQPVPLRRDATYVISGGLGALGLSLAEFLAGDGAGSLALLGRSAPDPAAAARIDALRGRDVLVTVHAVDVADEAALDAALADVRATAPPIRGVVHAAGLLDDATIGTLEGERLGRVLAPKVDGAVHLVRATRADPLDGRRPVTAGRVARPAATSRAGCVVWNHPTGRSPRVTRCASWRPGSSGWIATRSSPRRRSVRWGWIR